MAAKSVLKNGASALLALLLGTAALLPATASAQERDQRGPARMERMERPAPAPAPAQQAPAWQNRAPAAQAAPSGWQGRPAWSSNSSQPERPVPPANQGGWQGRQAWQNGGGDRERGDRGNGVNPAGQPAFGRPAWATGGQVPQPRTDVPGSGTRNPTYVDPNRGGRGWQGNSGGDRDGRARDNDGRGNNGGQWQNDGRGNWNRDRDGDRNDNWRRNNNGQWNRGGWGANTSRNWNRDRDRDWNRDRNGWRGNNWGYNNGWRGNGWGNNGWRGWDRDGWRRDRRYDWYGWRNSHRSIFSLGFYSAPWRGYSYSRLGIGVVIGAPFYDQRYWIADPWAYRLPPAGGPYRWVRYYDDALLVDIYSGEVVDVIYDIFW